MFWGVTIKRKEKRGKLSGCSSSRANGACKQSACKKSWKMGIKGEAYYNILYIRTIILLIHTIPNLCLLKSTSYSCHRITRFDCFSVFFPYSPQSLVWCFLNPSYLKPSNIFLLRSIVFPNFKTTFFLWPLDWPQHGHGSHSPFLVGPSTVVFTFFRKGWLTGGGGRE